MVHWHAGKQARLRGVLFAMGSFFRQDEIDRQASVLYGFALYSVWTFVALHDVLRFAANAEKTTPSLFFSICTPLALAGCMLLVGLNWKRGAAVLSRPVSTGLLSAAALVGSFMMVLLDRESVVRSIGSIGAQVCFELLLLVWFKTFANFDLEIIVKKIPGILALMGAVCGILLLVPSEAQMVLLATLPLGQAAFLIAAEVKVDPAPESTRSADRRVLEKVIGGALAFCALVGLLLSFARFNSRDHLPTLFYYFFLLEVGFILFGASCFIAASSYRNRRVYANTFSARPMVSIALCALVLAGTPFAFNAERVYSCIGLGGFNIAFIVLFLLMGKHFSCSSVHLFALGRAAYSAMAAVGNFAVLKLIDIESPQGVDVATFILIFCCQALVAICFTAFWMVRHSAGVEDQEGATHAEMPALAGTADPDPDAGGQEEPDRDRPSAISLLARRYRLSERETEVAALFIKGRSVKRTSEELFLSTGTVNTYLRRIYQKMDIHTRQELLDLFDAEKEQARGR